MSVVVEWWQSTDRIVVTNDDSAQAFTYEEAKELEFRLGIALREADAEARYAEERSA